MNTVYAEVWIYPKEGRTKQIFIDKNEYSEARLKNLVLKLLSDGNSFQVMYL